MTLNTFKCNYMTPLHFKGLGLTHHKMSLFIVYTATLNDLH